MLIDGLSIGRYLLPLTCLKATTHAARHISRSRRCSLLSVRVSWKAIFLFGRWILKRFCRSGHMQGSALIFAIDGFRERDINPQVCFAFVQDLRACTMKGRMGDDCVVLAILIARCDHHGSQFVLHSSSGSYPSLKLTSQRLYN